MTTRTPNRPEDSITFDAPPFSDAEAEAALLGAIMQHPDDAEAAFSVAPPEAFWRLAHRNLAALLRDMRRRRVPIDVVTVLGETQARGLDFGGAAYVVGLPDKCPASAAGPHYARIVADRWARREVVSRCRSVMAGLSDPGTDTAASVAMLTASVGSLGGSVEDDFVRWDEVVAGALDSVKAAADGDVGVTGPRNPFRDWGELIPYFSTGEVHIIAARPAMGKSALARKLAECIADDTGRSVVVFSLEMEPKQIAKLALGDAASVSIMDAERNRIDQGAWDRLEEARHDVAALPFHVCRSASLSIDDVTGKTLALANRLEKRGERIGAIVLDYLQLLIPGRDDRGVNRNEVVARISRGLKLLARALDVPVIALSQLNRDVETRQDKRPVSSDLRDSGAIEQDAATITMVYREAVYDKAADPTATELIVTKCRYGRTGAAHVTFEGAYTRFSDTAPRDVLDLDRWGDS